MRIQVINNYNTNNKYTGRKSNTKSTYESFANNSVKNFEKHIAIQNGDYFSPQKISMTGKSANSNSFFSKIKSYFQDSGTQDNFEISQTKEILESGDIDLIRKALLTGVIDLSEIELGRVSGFLTEVELGEILNKFIQRQLVEDENREIPMHKYNAKQMCTTIYNLQDFPEIVGELMCHKNINGEIPIHKILNNNFSENNYNDIYNIFIALDKPNFYDFWSSKRVLLSVFETKNKNGNSVVDLLNEYQKSDNPSNMALYYDLHMLEELYYRKKHIEEEYENTNPFITDSDLKRKENITNIINQHQINHAGIMNVLNDNEVTKTKGLDLNLHDNYIAEIIDFLINYANKNERKEVIAKLKELNKIDYDKVNSFGISTAELVINAEDNELLELIKNSTFKYRPELGYAYNNIQNPNFKNKVRKIKIDRDL